VTSLDIVLSECEEGSRVQVWNVDIHSRIHNEKPSKRSGCIFVSANNTLTYKNKCGKPENFNKFSYNLFDSKIINEYKAMTVVEDIVNGSTVKMRKPRPFLDGQEWNLIFEPLDSQLKLVGCDYMEGGSEEKCAICSGDCDRDEQCEGGLRCAQRRLLNGREKVPGCFFGEDSSVQRLLATDYCFLPVDVSEKRLINYIGECGFEDYKCKQCEGSCRNDDDCEGDLHCVKRQRFEAVEGCSGAGGDLDVYGKNVCSAILPIVEFSDDGCTVNDDCQICNTCGNDVDCNGDLRCAKRSFGSHVQGCLFDSELPLLSSENVCFLPLSFPGNAGLVSYIGDCRRNKYLCGRCEGGCVSDSDCAGNLSCLERDGVEHVPGCYKEGGQWDMAGSGICYDANLVKPELRFYSVTNPSHGYPNCAKGCLDDADCRGLLRCAIREGLEDVPGCRWGSNSLIEDFYASVPNSHNYCFKPSDLEGLDLVNYVGECSSKANGYLCGACEGNCKSNSDCKFGYKCKHRSSFEQVPGCGGERGGRDMYGKGICYDPSLITV